MHRSDRTINYQVAFSMALVWLVAMGLLVAMLLLTLVPEIRHVEQRQMREHLVRAISLVQADLKRMRAFARDWGEWDDAYDFIAGKGTRAFIDGNLVSSTPMDDFDLHLLSFMDLRGNEIWSRSRLPDIQQSHFISYPLFMERLEQVLLKRVGEHGIQGMQDSQWGPLLFAFHPITDSQRRHAARGYLLAARWIDASYLSELSHRVAMPITMRGLHGVSDLTQYQPLQQGYLYRMGYSGLHTQWGEIMMLDSVGQPGLLLRLESQRELMLGGGRVLLYTLAGTLLICLVCGLFAFYRLQVMVLQPLGILIKGVQRYERDGDSAALPVIESSREMRILTRRFREMAARLSLQHKAAQAHSQRMEEVANRDPLTGCFNRRYLDAWLEMLEPSALHLAVLAIDLDHFKGVNDTHGHDMGDRVLIQFAERLRRNLRHDELLVRVGGEEFLVVSECTEAAQASALAERLRCVVAQLPFGEDQASFAMTASIGFALYPLGEERHEAGWRLSLKLADMALYNAKARGRNTWTGLVARHGGVLPSLNPDDLLRQGALSLIEPPRKEV